MAKDPPWFVTGNKLKGRVFPEATTALSALETPEALHESLVPLAALFHVSDALTASMLANSAGQHSVAVSLLRSCLEALTLVDLGFQKNEYRLPRLRKWNDRKRTATFAGTWSAMSGIAIRMGCGMSRGVTSLAISPAHSIRKPITLRI